jgi:homospermidine synthase
MDNIKNITDKNIVFFGCGGVAKAVLCYINKFFVVDPKKITIIDLLDYKSHPDVAYFLSQGATYRIENLNKKYKDILRELKPYDIVIDLSCSTTSISFMKECKKMNLHYINTSIEYDEKINFKPITEENLYDASYLSSHNEALNINHIYNNNRATMVPTFGFNPGMITMMIKIGIIFMAKNHPQKSIELDKYIKHKAWGKLVKHLGIDVIHCSETDNSEYLDIRDDKSDVFTNTWCVDGFVQEGMIDNCEFAFGTDQKTIPNGAIMFNNYIINMKKPAINFYSESYVPFDGKIIGIIIPHSESISGPLFFSDVNDLALNTPTMHYVYKYSPIAYRAVKRIEKTQKLEKTHILNNIDDRFKGIDRVGALLLTKDKKAVWVGSMLDNSNTPTSNGTLIQVSTSILSALRWMVDNPTMGIVFPEVLDEEYIIKLAAPYLGQVFCDFVDYKPDNLQFGSLQRTKEQFENQYKAI